MVCACGRMNQSGSTRAASAREHTTKGVRKRHGPSTRSYSTPPITGPTMQPTAQIVPTAAITAPSDSLNVLVMRMMHAVSASAPVSPLRK